MANMIDVSGLFFFMPVFSFLFVFVVVFAVLAKTKVLGDGRVNLLVSFIMAIIFMNFTSLDLFVKTITPWFIVLVVCLFFVLVIIGFSTKSFDKMMTPAFAWTIVAILVVIFLVSAIRVFNPVFHPDLIVTSGDSSSVGIVYQIRQMFDSSATGSILLLIIGAIVAWFLVKK
ncbi:MAG: hypothetical protein Q8N99_05375 [Nanoarchaeota archaeon]|nr:hypothetical protein [Nanoarchaeota archaeon]